MFTHRSKSAFRGFCDNLLEDNEISSSPSHNEDSKLSIQVPKVIHAEPETAAITFEEDECSSSNNSTAASIPEDDEQENSIDYLSVTDVKVLHYLFDCIRYFS